MIQKYFAVLDVKAKAFLQPFPALTIECALRSFGDAMCKSDHMFSAHPEDYVLYELADLDDNSGEFVPCRPLKMLGRGTDFVPVSVPMVPVKEVVANGS